MESFVSYNSFGKTSMKDEAKNREFFLFQTRTETVESFFKEKIGTPAVIQLAATHFLEMGISSACLRRYI
jgi:hypothetical protein